MVKALRRPVLLGIGWLRVGLGVIGIVLPLFPTTPFLLVALWAFSRSSPELAERIRTHRLAGRYVRDWEDEGVIPTGAKLIAVVMMTTMIGYMHFGTDTPAWVQITAGLTMAGAAAFVLSRPGRRSG